MKVKILGIFLGVCLVHVNLMSQNGELLVIDFQQYGQSSVFNQSGKISMAFPLLNLSQSKIFIAPEYKFFTNPENELLTQSCYQQLSVRFGYQYKPGEFWKLQWMLVPVITSPFSEISGLLFNSALRLNRNYSHFSYYFGIAYSYRYMNNIITPVMGLYWQPSDAWSLSGRLPVYCKIQHKLNPRLYAGVELAGNGISAQTESEQYDYVWIRERNIGLFAGWKVVGNWWLEGSVGYTVSRKIKSYQFSDDQNWTIKLDIGEPGIKPVNELNEHGLMCKTVLKYRLK